MAKPLFRVRGLYSFRALTLLFLVIFITATVATGLVTLLTTYKTIDQLVDRRIQSESYDVSGYGAPARRDDVIRRINFFSGQRDKGDVGYVLTDTAGRHLAGNMRLPHPLPPGYSTLTEEHGIRGLTGGRAYVRDIGDGLRLTTLAETEPIPHYNHARIRIYLIGYGSIIVIVVGGIALFGVLIHRKLSDMLRTIHAIIDGDMQQRFPVDGSGSEFDQQAQAFNLMLDRIAALMDSISNVSNDIAHDLRTPLSRMRGQLVRLKHQATTPEMTAGLQEALGQTDQLLEMFAAILRIAEVEGGKRRAGFTLIPIATVLRDISTMMAPVAEEAGKVLDLSLSLPETAMIMGDRQLLHQAFINLIENAISYSDGGDSIRITARLSGAGIAISISDNGPGIAADKREEALRRFGRLDISRTHHAGGAASNSSHASSPSHHGLGLPLVAAIARLHQGHFALTNARPGHPYPGLCATMELPTNQPHD